MLSLELKTPPEIVREIAQRMRRSRLQRSWTQQELSRRSGVSLSSLRRFERTGQVALLSLVRIAIALDATQGLASLFPETLTSLDDVLEKPRRQRGRRS